jgi:hypothetical protein
MYVRFYWLSISASTIAEAEIAKSQWSNLADFAQWTLPILARRTPEIDPALLAEAENRSRRALVAVARAMFLRRDLSQFANLMQRLADLGDE